MINIVVIGELYDNQLNNVNNLCHAADEPLKQTRNNLNLVEGQLPVGTVSSIQILKR